MSASSATLYYIHDPMCSWCWGFRSTWDAIQARLPQSLNIAMVLGGLAPDSSEPMPKEMQAAIQGYWRRIQEQIPSVEFNYDFWHLCQPRRSTYPACRAVIAAKQQGEPFESQMIDAIQRAYYLHAQNPSDDDTLIQLAVNLGLDRERFSDDLNGVFTQNTLEQNIERYHYLSLKSGVSGFPSLVLALDADYLAVPRDYINPETTLDFIYQHLPI